MDALRAMGVTAVIGICAVGSLRTDLPTGSVLLPNDFIEAQSLPPVSRPLEVLHTDVRFPYCERLRSLIAQTLAYREGFHPTGVMVGVVGPRFESPAEVRALHQIGADVVGMTGVPEAIAAREAGICYASIACVTNLGVGLSDTRPSHGTVTQQMERMVSGLVPDLVAVVENVCPETPCTYCACGD